MTNQKQLRSRFCQTIGHIGAVHPVRAARLDFFGSITLVCGVGVLAKLVQTLLAH